MTGPTSEQSALTRRLKIVLAEIESLQRSSMTADAIELTDRSATFGDRMADRIARVGGSWRFIIIFLIVLATWMALNTAILAHWRLAFDPYPYIFLNLILSMLAAIQAPVIMMSQNRLATRDRAVARIDYEIDLRAEAEIRALHAKLDILIAKVEAKDPSS